MILVSIDPSINSIGWAFWRIADFKSNLVASGTLRTGAGDEADKCREITLELRKAIFGNKYAKVGYVVIERPYLDKKKHQVNVYNILKLSMSIGAIIGCFQDAKPELVHGHVTKAVALAIAKQHDIHDPGEHEADAVSLGYHFIQKNRGSLC